MVRFGLTPLATPPLAAGSQPPASREVPPHQAADREFLLLLRPCCWGHQQNPRVEAFCCTFPAFGTCRWGTGRSLVWLAFSSLGAAAPHGARAVGKLHPYRESQATVRGGLPVCGICSSQRNMLQTGAVEASIGWGSYCMYITMM